MVRAARGPKSGRCAGAQRTGQPEALFLSRRVANLPTHPARPPAESTPQHAALGARASEGGEAAKSGEPSRAKPRTQQAGRTSLWEHATGDGPRLCAATRPRHSARGTASHPPRLPCQTGPAYPRGGGRDHGSRLER
jgi:hypothetical protein